MSSAWAWSRAKPAFGCQASGYCEMPCSMRKLNRGAPEFPLLVKIWITPFDASLPYSVAAAAPFRISTRSIDSGLMSSRRDIDAAAEPTFSMPPPLSTRTPSTYTTGSLDIERLLEPRMRIRAPAPAIPPEAATFTEGSRPARASENDCTGADSMFDMSRVAIVLPSCFFSTAAPAPVTTTVSRAITDCLISKLSSNGRFAVRFAFAAAREYPIMRTRRSTFPTGTLTI